MIVSIVNTVMNMNEKSSIFKTVEKNFRSIIDESKDILLDDETCKTLIEEEENRKKVNKEHKINNL